LAGPGNATFTTSGTSLAAPHVTGTVALLQEYANTQIGNSIPGWGPLSKRHQVMKAVMMNSADKVAGRLGSTRTVLKKNGDTWDDSLAAFNDLLPLDEEMGAGHLNAARAVQQYASGAQGPNGVPVPLIGWDFDSTDFTGDINKYAFNQELKKGRTILAAQVLLRPPRSCQNRRRGCCFLRDFSAFCGTFHGFESSSQRFRSKKE